MWQTYTVNDQTAGYITKWKDTKLGFVTVHKAGHEVSYTAVLMIPFYLKLIICDRFLRTHQRSHLTFGSNISTESGPMRKLTESTLVSCMMLGTASS